MLNEMVWCVCIMLEALLLIRGARMNFVKKFALFYVYIGCVLAKDVVSTPVYVHYPTLYGSFYWAMEFLLAVVSYGVLMEIYDRSLTHYPGVAKFFKILLFTMFVAIAAKVGAGWFTREQLSLVRTIADLGRYLRQLQALLLIGLLTLLLYYKISTNRNLRGVLLGYTLFIGADVLSLTFMAHPSTGFAVLMRTIEPLSYMVSLVIWLFALWVPSPEVADGISCQIEKDYESLAREMRMILIRARTHLTRAARP